MLIMFRGQRKENAQWVYGGFHRHQKITPPLIGPPLDEEEAYVSLIVQSGFSDWNLPKPLIAYEVKPETVGQFTGFYATKAYREEIYVGHLVRLTDDHGEKIGAIVFHEGMFAYTSDGVQAQPLGRAHDFEVLGNVVDHPDWLAKIAAFR